MTLYLPPHQENRFYEILTGITCSQKRIIVDKWHQVLGELRYVATNLTGYRNLFSHIQEALCHVDGKKVVITRGIHQDLAEFQWLTEDLVQRPT